MEEKAKEKRTDFRSKFIIAMASIIYTFVILVLPVACGWLYILSVFAFSDESSTQSQVGRTITLIAPIIAALISTVWSFYASFGYKMTDVKTVTQISVGISATVLILALFVGMGAA